MPKMMKKISKIAEKNAGQPPLEDSNSETDSDCEQEQVHIQTQTHDGGQNADFVGRNKKNQGVINLLKSMKG